jgi:hypothetical protein
MKNTSVSSDIHPQRDARRKFSCPYFCFTGIRHFNKATLARLRSVAVILLTLNVLFACTPPLEILTPLAVLDTMSVYRRPNGNYLIDYFNAGGEAFFHADVPIPVAGGELYDAGGVMIILSTTGEVYLTESVTDWPRTRVVNPEGIVVEQDVMNGNMTYTVHFVDQSTGQMPFHADIVASGGGQWEARFAPPINEIVPVIVSTDFDENKVATLICAKE